MKEQEKIRAGALVSGLVKTFWELCQRSGAKREALWGCLARSWSQIKEKSSQLWLTAPQPKQEHPRVLPEILPHAVALKPTSLRCVSVAPSENRGAVQSVHQVTPCKALRALRPHPVPHLVRESDPGLFAQLFLPYFPYLLNTRSTLYLLMPHLPISLSDLCCYLSSLSPSFVRKCIIFFKGFFQVLSAVTLLPQLLSSYSQVSSCMHQHFSKYGCQPPSVPWVVSCFSHHV